MMRQWTGIAAGLVALLACSPGNGPQSTDEGAAEPPAAAPAGAVQTAALACAPTAPLENRASAYDSVSVDVGGASAKVCYGRPAMKGRQVFGSLIPYDTLWRTGANEPTIIHLPVAAKIAGIAVEPGSYSLYTVPGREQWTVVVNRATSQWGHESRYTPEVRAQEVGRATVTPQRTDAPVETFTITAPAGNLVLEWENTRVQIPVTPS